jgi:hypothetical protein
MELPMSADLMMGDVAEKEMIAVHTAIHAIAQLPAINFEQKELNLLYGAMRFLCEKTNPGETSEQVVLLRRIKKHITI